MLVTPGTPASGLAPLHALAHRARRRAIALVALVFTGVLVAGCGSSKSSTTTAGTTASSAPASTTAATTTPTATAQAQQAPSAATSAQRTAFAACMAKAHWHIVGNPVGDIAARTLAVQPGFQGVVFVADKHGDHVAVGLFATGPQAEKAQVKVGLATSGNARTAYAPGAPLAWINYTGRTPVDQKVAGCAIAAAHS